ncbi:MAG: hypothetical protein ABIU86_04375 [Gemmatimonadaceae bacterium]
MTDASKLSSTTLERLQRRVQTKDRKIKTSLSISAGLIEATDIVAGKSRRSALVERALRRYLRAKLARLRDQRDLKAINARAAVTNREARRLLDLQSWPE